MLRKCLDKTQGKAPERYTQYIRSATVISFFVMIFKASLLIQITNINQLCIANFVR